MKPIGQVAQVYSYSRRRKPSIAIEGKITEKEIDEILDSYPVLIDDRYRGHYVIKLKALGKKEFIKRADRAMKYGNNPQKLFAHLMK